MAACRHPAGEVVPPSSAAPATREVVMVANLVNDSLKAEQYLAYHRKVWPKVEAGFRKAGYQDIRLFRFNRTLVMIITVPANADLAAMGRAAEAFDPKCKEWNDRMAGYQVGVPGTLPGQKWVQADLFYHFSGDSTTH